MGTNSEMEDVKFGFTAIQIIEEGRTTEKDVLHILNWLGNLNLPNLTHEQIVLFLLSCSNNHDLTKHTIKSYYNCKEKAPTLFNSRKIDRVDIQKQLQTVNFCVIPERTDHGYAIIYHSLYDTNAYNYEMGPSMKLLFMTLDAAIHDHPPHGLIILFNMEGMSLLHLTRIKLGLVKMFFQYVQEALPVQLRAIHVLNTSYLVDKVMSIIKPFVKKEVLEKLHFHSPTINMDSFYEEHLPKKCLPEDFGGDLPPVRTLHQKNIEKLTEMESHFKAEELQRCNSK